MNRLDKLKKVQLILNKILETNKELLYFICVEQNKEFRESLIKFANEYHEINGKFIDYLMKKTVEFTNKDLTDLEFKKLIENYEKD